LRQLFCQPKAKIRIGVCIGVCIGILGILGILVGLFGARLIPGSKGKTAKKSVGIILISVICKEVD
jgi:hypothetical protein